MRIALLSRRFDPSGGGTERDLIITADYLERAGHRVVIYAAEVRGAGDGRAIRLVPTPPLGRALRLWRFAYLAPAIARRDDADLIVSFARSVGAEVMRSGGGAHVSYLRAARKWRGALAARAMHLSPYQRVQMHIEERGFRSSRLKLAIAISNVVHRDLVEQFKLPADKVPILYNGVDLERFRPRASDESRRRIRQALGVPDSAPVVMFVGNGFARKGLPFMLEAWPRLESRPWLLVVGNDRARAGYGNRARTLNVGDRIRFLGPRNDVAELFHAADVLALPSIFEPFGNVVLEAMASGLKVVTSAASGVSELLPDELRAFTIENPCDPAEIAQRLDALIEAPADLGAQARAAAESYSWERYGENLTRLLETIA
ncbi:MAG TPA: glycosyltransferase family 4 protein [Candidatus Binataceae bacterium]|nr:glycosyltransferase family 4 protein [Candidatus Binataceae bacterium]